MAVWTRRASANPPEPATAEGPATTVTGPQAWLNGTADRGMVATLLRDVIDPEIGVNIVDLGLVYAIRISEGTAQIRMSLTTPGCPLSAYMEDSVHRVLWGSPGIDDIDLQIIWDPAWTTDMMSKRAKQELGWPV